MAGDGCHRCKWFWHGTREHRIGAGSPILRPDLNSQHDGSFPPSSTKRVLKARKVKTKFLAPLVSDSSSTPKKGKRRRRPSPDPEGPMACVDSGATNNIVPYIEAFEDASVEYGALLTREMMGLNLGKRERRRKRELEKVLLVERA